MSGLSFVVLAVWTVNNVAALYVGYRIGKRVYKPRFTKPEGFQ